MFGILYCCRKSGILVDCCKGRALDIRESRRTPLGWLSPQQKQKIAPTDNVVLTYQIINSSKGESSDSSYLQQAAANYLQQAAAKRANAAVTALASSAGAAVGSLLGLAVPIPLVGSALSALAGWLIGTGWDIAFPDRDGPVAAGVHIFSGAYLKAQTANRHKLTTTENNLGVNSKEGCGSAPS